MMTLPQKTTFPKCCEKEMRRVNETMNYIEFMCEKCGDFVLVRKRGCKI
jgi:predicted RNA-binding Zn-ribbon protein involved in translation (DUF1610 family)